MATVTFKGSKVNTIGDLPNIGSRAPEFNLTNRDLRDVGLSEFGGKKKIISIVHSLDTGTCADSAKRFSKEIAGLEDTVLLNISADLPFASARFCDGNGIENIVTLSTFRSPEFGRDYGVEIVDGPIRGLLARSIVVLDENNIVLHTQQGPELAEEPDYGTALKAVKA